MLDQVLPPELLIYIFQKLCLTDQLQLSLVSRHFHHIFWSAPAAVRKGLFFKIVNDVAKFELLLQSNMFQYSAVKELVLSDTKETIDRILEQWPLLAPQLSSFTFYSKRISRDKMLRLLEPCSSLTSLSLIVPRWNDHCLPEHLSILSKSLSHVQHFTFHLRFPKLLDASSDDLKANSLTNLFDTLMKSFWQLRTLNLNCMSFKVGCVSHIQFAVVLTHLKIHAASLRSLEMRATALDDQKLLEVASIPNLNLSALDISQCNSITQEGFIQLCRLQPGLQSLKIDGNRRILVDYSSSLQRVFDQKLLELKCLSIKEISAPWRFPNLLTRLGKLQELHIVSCDMPPQMIANCLNSSFCKLRKLTAPADVVVLIQPHVLQDLGELRTVEIDSNDVFSHVWQHCHNVEKLEMCGFFRAAQFPPDQPIPSNLAKLTDLNADVKSCDVIDVALKLFRLANLRKLTAIVDLKMDSLDRFLRGLASQTPSLEFLRVLIEMDMEPFFGRHKDAKKFAEYWPRMIKIDIEY